MCGPKFCSMKISQEVRDFAKANPPRDGEGATARAVTQVKFGGGADATLEEAEPKATEGQPGTAEMSDQEIEKGMAAMSTRYRDGGNELYVGANGREHD